MKERLANKSNNSLKYPNPSIDYNSNNNQDDNKYMEEHQPFRKVNLIKQPDSSRTLIPSLAVKY